MTIAFHLVPKREQVAVACFRLSVHIVGPKMTLASPIASMIELLGCERQDLRPKGGRSEHEAQLYHSPSPTPLQRRSKKSSNLLDQVTRLLLYCW
jgi:hypothetical protein